MTAYLAPGRFCTDPSLPLPLHNQFREDLREPSRRGNLPEGMFSPSERELSEIYRVNRLAVRQPMTKLVNEGLFDRKHAAGTFVFGLKIVRPLSDALSWLSWNRQRDTSIL